MFNALLHKFKEKAPVTSTHLEDESLSSDSQWRPGDIILDRYLVEDVFSGAMGRVFIAEHLGWKVKMAIKVPKPSILADREGMQRILTEANSWVKMGMHPNIATCYYVLTIDETPYIFIEYVDGGDLSSWIKTGRCRDLRTSLSLAIQFCHGMEFTHSHGIIHRDIKPGNVLISKDAFLKITDFGIIQTKKKEGSASAPLAQGESEETIGFRGTPSYASPEQFKDSHNIDYRSDIFSFGICLWLMFCGHRPFQNNASLQNAEPIPKVPKGTFPLELDNLLQKVVALDPDHRHQTFAELRHALNIVYIALFKVPCPYMDLDVTSLQADNLNNRAVSFLELSQKAEGVKCLQKSLDIDDNLTEAIFNHILFKWQNGADPALLLKQLEASQKRHPEAKMLDTLTQAIKCDLSRTFWKDDEVGASHPNYYPEYLLCRPKNSLAIFQQSQLRNSAKENIKDLWRTKQYDKCYKILFRMWRNDHFRKEDLSLKVYERLQKIGTPKNPATVIRIKTIRKNRQTPEKLLYLPSTSKICTLYQGALTCRSLTTSSKHPVQQQHKAVLAATSPDGRYLATALANGTATLLESATGRTIASFEANAMVTALSINHNNSILAVGYDNGSIRKFFLNNTEKKLLVVQSSEVLPITTIIQFSNGDDYISGNSQGTIMHWQANETEPLRIIKAHDHSVKTMIASPNGLFFISGENGPALKIWNRQTGQCLRTIVPHEGLPFSLIYLQDGKHLITGSDDDIIKMWDIASGEPLFILDGRGDGITAISTGPYPNVFLTGAQDGSITIWMIIYELDFS